MSVVLGQALDLSHYTCDHEFHVLAQAEHPRTVKLIDYWYACAAKGGMRMGRDIPARAIAPLLKDITVTEPVDDWRDGRVRLAGFGMAAHFGRDVAGELMSDIFAGNPSDMRMLLDGARIAIAHNQPGTVEHIISNDRHVVLRQEMTALPLVAPDGNGHWILVGTFNY